MHDFREQRACIKLCQKLDDSASETFEKIIIPIGNDSAYHSKPLMTIITVKHKSRSDRPQNEVIVARIHEKPYSDRIIPDRQFADETGISVRSFQEILIKNLVIK